MEKVFVCDIFKEKEKYLGKEVTIEGWIRQIRDSKQLAFIELNDGTFFKPVQVIAEDDKISNYKEVAKLNLSASILVTGKLVETPNGKQPFEIKAEKNRYTWNI